MVVLQEARNVKYTGLVVPGDSLMITAELQKREDDCTWFKAKGVVNNKTVLSGRLILQRMPEGDAEDPRGDQLRRFMRNQFAMLCNGGSV